MLVYVHRSDVNTDTISTGTAARVPPHHVMTAVDELNERYHRKCEEYNKRLSGAAPMFGETLTYLTGRRPIWSDSPRFGNKSRMFTVRGKYHLPQRSGTSLTFPPSLIILQAVVVSKQSLESWLACNQSYLPQPNDDDAGVREEISVSDILCEHGALDPSQASRMKCINEAGAKSAARVGKLNLRIRTPTRRFWLLDASSPHYSILATSAQFASRKHTKVRNLQPRDTRVSDSHNV